MPIGEVLEALVTRQRSDAAMTCTDLGGISASGRFSAS